MIIQLFNNNLEQEINQRQYKEEIEALENTLIATIDIKDQVR